MSKVRSFVTATTLAVAASLAGGCVLHGTGEVSTGVYAEPADHQVVYVSPGVWVVENYHAPVFYSDGYYWERRGGYWYRSSYYNGGFVRVGYNVVPYRIRSVRRPRSYVRYRARPGVRTRSVRAYNRGNRRGNVRDRRYDRRNNVRDRRYDRRSNTRDRRSRAPDRRYDRRSNTRDRRYDRGETRDKRKRGKTRDKRRRR